MALADTANLIVQLRLDDKLSGPLGRVNSQLRGLGAGVGQVGRGVNQLGTGAFRVAERGAIAFGIGVVGAVKVAADFESQLNTINTIAKLSDRDLTKLGAGIRETFRSTGQPLEDLTAAYYDLLSAGIKVSDAQSVLNTAVKLGVGGLATTAESVDLLTTAINAYGLNAQGAAAASDIFAAAVRDGKVKVSELNASFADVAPLASQVGIRLEEIGAGYATLTARGVEATEVGTQFNRAIIELLKPGPELIKIMKGLGLASFETSIRQKGLVQTLEDVRVEAAKQGIPFQEAFGRLEAYKFALATTGPNQAKFNSELVAMGKAAGETNAQFEERAQGLNYQLGKLKSAAQDAGITIGQALIPKLVPLIERLSTFINANQDKIATFGQKLADGLGAFADKLQTIDFGPMISGLKIAAGVAKSAFDIFTSLPPALQGAIITGFAVNKLSGGLIGQGAGNIAGGLLKIAFTRGNSPATPLFVSQVGGIGGGAPIAPVAGGGGLLGGITKFLGLTTAVGLGAVIGNEIGRNVFFDPTVQPAVKYETSQFTKLLASNDTSRLESGLDALDDGLRELGGDTILGNLLFGDQIRVLKDQKQTLQAKLDRIAQIENSHSSQFERSRATIAELAGLTRANAEPLRLTALQTANAARMTERTLGPLGVIAGKNFSPTIVNNNTVNASLSVAQALNTITITNSIRYDGKLVPL